MSLIGIEESILVQLSPLKQLDLDVRGVPNQSNRQGLNSTHAHGENGRLLLYWESDRPVDGQNDLGAVTQTFESIWTLEGRITNLRDESGILRLRDLIYNRLLGFQPTGALSPMQVVEFQMLPREENRYVFESRFSCQTFWVGDEACAEPEKPIPGLNSTLKEVLFLIPAGDLKDKWDVNKSQVEIQLRAWDTHQRLFNPTVTSGVVFPETSINLGGQTIVNPTLVNFLFFPTTFLQQPEVLDNTTLVNSVEFPGSTLSQNQALENLVLVNSVEFFDTELLSSQIFDNPTLVNSVEFPDSNLAFGLELINTTLVNDVVFPPSGLAQSGILENTTLVNAVVFPTSSLIQSQSISNTTLVNSVEFPGSTLSQKLALENTTLVNTVVFPETFLVENQVLENTVLINGVIFPPSTITQSQALQNTVLVNSVVFPATTFSMAQGLSNTTLINAVTFPATALSQKQALNNTTLVNAVVLPASSIVQKEILENTTLVNAVVFPATSLSQSSGGGTATLTVNNVVLRNAQLQLTELVGDQDWLVVNVDEKLNGTAIAVTNGPSTTTATEAPVFRFSDGTTNTGDQQIASQYQFGTSAATAPTVTVAVPSGKSQVTVWIGTGSSTTATVTATDGTVTTGPTNFNQERRVEYQYDAPSAGTITITLDPGTNANAGIFAVALSTETLLTTLEQPDVLWFPTTEGAGTNLYDPVNGWVGNFQNGTMTWASNLLTWAGGDVVCPDNNLENLIETLSTGSAMVWVSPDALGSDQNFFTAKNNTSNEGRMWFMRGDPSGASGGGTNVIKMGYRTNPTSGAQGVQAETASGDWALGWQHYCMSFATGSEATPRFQFWKNGVLLTQANFTFYPSQFPDNTLHSQGDFLYGWQGNGGKRFFGQMAGLRLYTYEVSTAEVQAVYEATRARVGV